MTEQEEIDNLYAMIDRKDKEIQRLKTKINKNLEIKEEIIDYCYDVHGINVQRLLELRRGTYNREKTEEDIKYERIWYNQMIDRSLSIINSMNNSQPKMKEYAKMTVEQFLEAYGGNVCVSIPGHCWELDIDEISEDTELLDEIKDLEITFWNVKIYEDGELELIIETKN